MRKISVFPDQIYGRLKVIERVANDSRGRPVFKCMCSCSDQTILNVAANSLRTHNTESCGCLKRELAAQRCKARTKAAGEAAAWALFTNYRNGARRRHLPFRLKFSAFRRLCQMPCHYCGAPPHQETHVPRVNGQYLFTGLDLVVRTDGYRPDNVVPSCWQCNRARRTLPVPDFIVHIRRIYAYQLLLSKVICEDKKN